MNCHLCLDAGHPSPAHRIVDGKGVCRDHYAGALIPGQPISNGAAHELPKENGMRAKIDRDELRKLHAEGLNDVQTAAKLGCSAVGVLKVRRELGLAANRKHAHANGHAVGVGLVPARRGRPPKAQRPAAIGAANPTAEAGAFTLRLTAKALDAIWALLAIEQKGRLIEDLGDLDLD